MLKVKMGNEGNNQTLLRLKEPEDKPAKIILEG